MTPPYLRELIAICCFLPILGFAQSPFIQSDIYFDLCRFDSSVTVNQPSTHFFYQTTNNEFDGPIDSSFCANLVGENALYLDLSDYDFDRVLFIAQNIQEPFLPDLEPYENYLIDRYFRLENVEIDRESIVEDSIFSGIRVGYQFNDAVTGVSGQRESLFFFDTTGTGYYSYGESCFYSERFQNQQLTYLVAAFKLKATGSEPKIIPYRLGVIPKEEERSAVDYFEIIVPNSNDNGPFESYMNNAVRTVEPGGGYNFYLQQNDTLLPSTQNIRFTDANIFPNRTSQEELILHAYESTLYTPPYTGIRGGLVEGQDSLRHQLTLSFIDAFPSCYYMIVDLWVPNGVTYLFGDGNVEFAGPSNCFILREGGCLAIAENSTFNYGYRGIGLLATKHGSRLDLEAGSTLNINVLWHLAQDPLSGRDNDTHVYMKRGSKLVFGPQAELDRSHPDGQGYLYIHLAPGASVDWKNLSAEERALIRIVQPDYALDSSRENQLLVYPNPTLGAFFVQIPPGLEDENASVEVYDQLGKLLLNQEISTRSNQGAIQLEQAASLPSGIYTVKLSTNQKAWNTQLIIR